MTVCFRVRNPNARAFYSLVVLVYLLFSVGVFAKTPSSSAGIPAVKSTTHGLHYREWTSVAGQTIQAAFVNLHQGRVVLASETQEKIVIPIDRLQWADQIYARGLHGQSIPQTPQRNNDLTLREESDSRVIPAFGAECETLLLHAISEAQHEILIAIYTFTSENILDALLKAAERDVRIAIKFDKGQLDTGRMGEIISKLKNHNNIEMTPIDMPGRYASMHHKFAIMDRSHVLTGSFNFTVTASTRSYENAVLIRSIPIALEYMEEFDSIDGKQP